MAQRGLDKQDLGSEKGYIFKEVQGTRMKEGPKLQMPCYNVDPTLLLFGAQA